MHKKRKTPYGIIFALLAVILVISYVLSGVFNYPDLSIYTFEVALLYTIKHPLQAWNRATAPIMGVATALWLFFVSNFLQLYRNFHANPYGSEDWRDVDEANRYYQDPVPENNRIVSQNLQISLGDRGLSNNNAMIITSSGGYKTMAFVVQNILQFGASYVVLDVKGDLCKKWGNAFLKNGYKVHKLDFKNLANSDRYNPFANINTEEDILRVAAAIHEAVRPKKEASCQDPFWDDAVLLYCQALFGLAWLQARETGKPGTMNDVMEFLEMESQKVGVDPDTHKEITKLQLHMEDLRQKYGPSYPPVRDYFKLKGGAPDTVNSVILMLNGMLKICSTAEVRRIFEDNDINIRDIGMGVGGDKNKKSIVFLSVKDNLDVYNWIVSVFYTQCFDILSSVADDECEGGSLPIRVEFWMDEFYAGCRPADVEKLVGIIRQRNMSMVIILQGISQIQTLYPEPRWKTIMANMPLVIFGGAGAADTDMHEWVSKVLGDGTIDLMQDSQHLGNNPNTGLSYSQKDRRLMTPGEVKDMPRTDAVIILESSKPIYDTKAIPFNTRDGRYKAPKWLKERYSEALSYGEYKHPVYTLYDEEHFQYITIKRDIPLQIFTDKKDMETLQNAAITNPDVYTFTVDEDKLLYLSWGHEPYSQETVERMYHKAMEDKKMREERLKGLIVLQNVENVPNFGTQLQLVDKSTWEECDTFKSLLAAHWDDLSLPEQEQICFGIDEGLTEEQLRFLMLRSLKEMQKFRMMFIRENRGIG